MIGGMRDSVVAPDGRTWRVQRQWVPRLGQETLWGRFHRRFRQTIRKVGDVGDPGCLEVFGEGLLIGLLILAFVLLGFPVLTALLDIALLILLAALALLARLLLRRPWIVEATADDGTSLTWRVSGW